MYAPEDLCRLAGFAFSECERFLDGDSQYFGGGIAPLSDADGAVRLARADGEAMNAASWIVGHMAWQWVRLATRAVYARDFPHLDGKFGQLATSDDEPLADLRRRVYRFRTGTDTPPNPPSIDEARQLLSEARSATAWLATADRSLLASTVGPNDASPRISGEPIGKNVVRAVLHTFTHAGEILAIRQVLGHAEVGFLKMDDLDWPLEARMD